MSALVGFSLAFVVSHLVMSSRAIRPNIISRLGKPAYLVLYSVVSLILFWFMIDAYIAAPSMVFWEPPVYLRYLAISVMPLAFILLVTGYSLSNPSMIGARTAPEAPLMPTGVYRVTRHPVMWAVGLWAISHLMVAGTSAALVFFSSIAALAFIGSMHLDRRKTAELGTTWNDFMAVTSNVPFVAIARGYQTFEWREIGIWRFMVALVLYAIVFNVHQFLFGFSPLPAPVE